MTGLRSSEGKDTLLQWFAPVTRLSFESSWWEEAWEYAVRLRKDGVSPTAPDCLIVTVAIKHRVSLIHCDTDFEAMKPSLPLHTLDWTGQLARR
jgi:predicted nucleic acid-binding protein